jgi:hypothetical protein
MIRKFLVHLFIILVCVNISFAQTLFSNTKYQLETGTHLSTSGITPFWLRSNQYGIVPLQAQFLTFRGSAHKEYDSTKNNRQKLKKFGIGYGFWGVANVNKQNYLLLLPEAYLKVRYGAFEFYGGRKREVIGLVDTTLSSGSYIWSGNALPMPKIQISIPNYTSIIGHGLISIKGAFAHGWFDNDQLSHSYLHQKSLYGRIGKENWKIKFYGGFNHQVQWGGKINLPYQLGTVKSNQLPSSFGDYIFAISGISLNYTSRQKNIDTTKYTYFDLTNRVGNHLGTLDVGFEMSTRMGKILFYRQSLYDDGSLFALANIKDGLIGLSIVPQNKNKGKVISLEKVVLESLNTSNQGGIIGPGSTVPEIRGRDNYFNHAQFLNGWSYQNKTIGTPFITPAEDIKSSYPKYIISKSPNYLEYFTNNNRVTVYYIGVQLKILDTFNYLFKGSYSKNFGSYDVPFTNKNKGIPQYCFQNSIQFEIRKKLKLNFNYAFDIGSLYQSSKGISCSIMKQW